MIEGLLIAVDPGPADCGVAIFRDGIYSSSSICTSDSMVAAWSYPTDVQCTYVIEMIGHYGKGMPVGAEVFHTCVWIGRFLQAWGPNRCHLVLRASIKARLCGTVAARDANVRQVIIDRLGGPAARKKGGILHGVKADAWQAIAVGLAWLEGELNEVKL